MGWGFCSLVVGFLLDTCIHMYCACIHMYSHAHTRYTSIHLQYKCDTCIPGAASRIHAIHVFSAIHHHDTSQYNTVIRITHMYCGALHFVQQPMEVWGYVECEGNPAGYVCDCKGCKSYGICSHLLAINHILKHFNVRYQLHGIGSSNRSKSGPGQGRLPNPEPALQRARIAREPDSSDEEQKRVLELGRQGSDEL